MCRHRGGGLNDWQARGQRRHIATEGAGDLHQRNESQIVFAPFDPADIAPVEARFMRQAFL